MSKNVDKPRINVLSLFDGMSCGRMALERAGIRINKYYASEIDKDCIAVTRANYPDTIHLGDVTSINVAKLPKIQLLIAGSPCQGFSFAGKQLNFNHPQSKLFFEFVRILKSCKPKYFLLENVRMRKQYEDVISEHLNVKPIAINSSLVSAQHRERLYWTNIPGVTIPLNQSIVFEDITCGKVVDSLIIPSKYKPTLKQDSKTRHYKPYRLGGYAGQGQGQRVYSMKGKSVCLSALGGGWGARTGLYLDGNIVRKPTQRELEKLQTVNTNYTKSINYNKASKMLGNGWTVDVITHIFTFLPESFYKN